jgi:phospholipase D1/2
MREHLGVDVDAMYEEDLMASEPVKPEMEIDAWDPDNEQQSKNKRVDVTEIGPSRHEKAIGSMAMGLKDAAMQGMN